jgi:type VI secretion system protein VasI
LDCFDRMTDRKLATPVGGRPKRALGVGKWRTSTSTSPIDDSRTVVLALKADSSISGWPGKSIVPTLMLRCRERNIAAYINTGMAAAVEDEVRATIRFDQDTAKTIYMNEATSNDALFFQDPISDIKRMLRAAKMTFRFTPFNSPPVTTTFTLVGLEVAIAPLREACDYLAGVL